MTHKAWTCVMCHVPHISFHVMLIPTSSYAYNITVLGPYFSKSRWSAIFFVSFLLVVNLFLFKLVIAMAYKVTCVCMCMYVHVRVYVRVHV